MTVSQKLAFYFGATGLVGAIWIVKTGIEAWLGTCIPDWLALDFAMPIAFIALAAPGPTHSATSFCSLNGTVLSLAFAEIPMVWA